MSSSSASKDDGKNARATKLSSTRIPMFIAKVPWYMAAEGADALAHQNRPESVAHASSTSGFSDPVRATVRSSTTSTTRFIRGSCENCGVMGHRRRECVERPRKHGAKWRNESQVAVGAGAGAEEKDASPAPSPSPSHALHPQFDAKRDRWAGYDTTGFESDVRLPADDDGTKKRRIETTVVQEKEAPMYRERSDKAAYLHDDVLDYDPKSRRRRGGEGEEATMAFVAASDGTESLSKTNAYIWEVGADTRKRERAVKAEGKGRREER
jgi:hypothetical protein